MTMEQAAPALALAVVPMPTINKIAAPASIRAKNSATGLAPNTAIAVSKNHAATMTRSNNSPNPTTPPGNREYSLSISFSLLFQDTEVSLGQERQGGWLSDSSLGCMARAREA